MVRLRHAAACLVFHSSGVRSCPADLCSKMVTRDMKSIVQMVYRIATPKLATFVSNKDTTFFNSRKGASA